MAKEKFSTVPHEAQDKMLVLIENFLEARRASPTMRDIAALYGCSPPFVLKVVRKLEKRGLLYRRNGRIMAISKVK